MNKFLKVASLSLCALAMASMSFAQAAGPKGGAGKPGAGVQKGAPGGGPGAGRQGGMRRGMGMNEEMMAKLGLSADQKKKIEALNKKTQDQMKAVFEGSKGDREKAREKMRPIMENQRNEMKKILTPAQQAKLEQLRKEMIEKFRKDGAAIGNRGGTAPKAGGKPPTPPSKTKKGGGGGN
ncbi:MAG TPA: hypothetical protein PKA27_01915 [Fimbriimonadaceae bacterium]|nr:hypothetical protein [Fimbriimonadaceae bacterium]